MTLLSEYVSRYGSDEETSDNVLKLMSEVLLPKKITSAVIQSYIRRALRNRTWFTLPRTEKALLKAASRVVKVVKSRMLAEALRRIFLKIDLGTLRGRAIYYGFIILAKTTKELRSLAGRVRQALIIGINYLNNPPLYRHLG